ncbi:MAG: PorT family protein [Bacteroidales bacterium]|nr:PorT family protein [Bacteroidales bacterium]MCM1148452.1 PorT family protein [Bacteroidales bacterium]MCM1207268.1 PorT family protein [Bacillota bacterium]MCM1511487.1 PorT family protein [Clostridium sp.]
MEENKWIDDLREKERDFEFRAPEGLWEDIERNLPSVSWSRPPSVRSWYRYGVVAAAVALCLAVLVPLLFSGRSGEDGGRVASVHAVRPVAAEGPGVTSESAGGDSHDFVRVALRPLSCAGVLSAEAADVRAAALSVVSVPADSLRRPSAGEAVAGVERACASFSAVSSVPSRQSPAAVHNGGRAESRRRPSRGGWSLTAYAGNLMADGRTAGSGYSPAVRGLSSYGEVSDVPIGENKAYDIVTMNRGERVETETRHRLPLRFGLSCGIPVSGRLSVETGLTYSILSSSSVSGTETNYFSTEQTLHYVGVPLKLRCGLREGRRFGVYVSGGVMAEKCVRGTSSTDCIIGGEKASSVSEPVRESRLQFSVVAGVGLAYRITEALNLFVEPAVSYSFDNHSNVAGSYKERPLSFDLKAGVRIDIRR